MKRILFYVIMFLQIVVILLLGWQFILIDKYGKNVDLLVEKNQYQSFGDVDYQGNVYVDYEVNTIDAKEWPEKIAQTYNEIVYVLLEADENGIYDVKEISDDRMKPDNDQVVFIARYAYNDSSLRSIQITYGIEKVKDQQLYKHLNQNEQMVVTIKVAPWGQKKIVSMKNVHK